MSERIQGRKIRCVGRRLSQPRLIHFTGRHRAMEIFVEGTPAMAEVVKVWKVIKNDKTFKRTVLSGF